MDGAFFHFPFFMGTSDIAGMGDNGKRSQEGQEGLIETDEGAVPLYNGRGHIIGNQFPGGSPEKAEGMKETPMEGLLPLGMGKLEVK